MEFELTASEGSDYSEEERMEMVVGQAGYQLQPADVVGSVCGEVEDFIPDLGYFFDRLVNG